jgi:hypothetical protein
MDRNRRNIHRINYANLARGQRDTLLDDEEAENEVLDVDSASEDDASEEEDDLEVLSEVRFIVYFNMLLVKSVRRNETFKNI